jgi:hypothetical protein
VNALETQVALICEGWGAPSPGAGVFCADLGPVVNHPRVQPPIKLPLFHETYVYGGLGHVGFVTLNIATAIGSKASLLCSRLAPGCLLA